jgi:endonuclease/exonuclease/phosphatase family metal-dependent hydrolase
MAITLRGSCACAVVVLSILSNLGCAGGDARGAAALDIEDPAPPPMMMSARAPERASTPPPVASNAGAPRVTRVTYPGSTAAARDLRVMSFNVRRSIFIDAMNHWTFRKDLLVDTILNFKPDLLGTQESLAGQTDYLRQQLHDYDFVGAGRGDGKRRGEMCAVYFRRDRFDKLDAGHFWLSETPTVPGSKSWGSSFTRMCTWVKLRDRAGGGVLCLFNTHFDHRGKRAREESARLLRRKIDQIAGDLPVVVTGDFNATDDSAPYRTLITGTRRGDERFTDTYRAANKLASGSGDGTRHDFWGGTNGPRIDWIVTSGEFKTVSASIDRTRQGGRYPSDHFPVTAVLRPAAPVGVARVQ